MLVQKQPGQVYQGEEDQSWVQEELQDIQDRPGHLAVSRSFQAVDLELYGNSSSWYLFSFVERKFRYISELRKNKFICFDECFVTPIDQMFWGK